MKTSRPLLPLPAGGAVTQRMEAGPPRYPPQDALLPTQGAGARQPRHPPGVLSNPSQGGILPLPPRPLPYPHPDRPLRPGSRPPARRLGGVPERAQLGDRSALPVVKSVDSELGKPAFVKMATKSKQTQPVQSALICLLPALMGVPYANQAHSTSLIDFLQASTLTSKA